MIISFRQARSERPDKYRRAERRRDCAVPFNRFSVIKKRVADPINVRGCGPGMNALPLADLMRGRSVAAICTDKNGPIDFPSKILQKSREQKNCTGHIVRKFAKEIGRASCRERVWIMEVDR